MASDDALSKLLEELKAYLGVIIDLKFAELEHKILAKMIEKTAARGEPTVARPVRAKEKAVDYLNELLFRTSTPDLPVATSST